MRSRLASIFCLSALAAACGQSDGDGEPTFRSDNVREESSELGPLILDSQIGRRDPMYHGSGGDSAVFDPECTISANGVAGIGLPLTLGEFANGFSTDTAMIYGHVYFDYAELCVLHQGRRAICALFEADDFNRHRLSFENNYAYEPSISVVALVVRAPHCRTQAGVGPGTDLVEAEGAYGDAVFDTERDAETRDFITFENAPPNLRFESDYADDPHSETDVVLMPSEEREQRLAREANERAEQPEPRQNVRIGKVWIYPTD